SMLSSRANQKPSSTKISTTAKVTPATATSSRTFRCVRLSHARGIRPAIATFPPLAPPPAGKHSKEIRWIGRAHFLQCQQARNRTHAQGHGQHPNDAHPG